MAFAETADYKCHTPSKKLLYFVFFHAMLDLLSKVYLNPMKSPILFVRDLVQLFTMQTLS